MRVVLSLSFGQWGRKRIFSCHISWSWQCNRWSRKVTVEKADNSSDGNKHRFVNTQELQPLPVKLSVKSLLRFSVRCSQRRPQPSPGPVITSSESPLTGVLHSQNAYHASNEQFVFRLSCRKRSLSLNLIIQVLSIAVEQVIFIEFEFCMIDVLTASVSLTNQYWEGRRRIDVNHTSQLESFTYLSGAGSGSVPFPDFCVIQNGCRKNFFFLCDVFGFYAESSESFIHVKLWSLLKPPLFFLFVSRLIRKTNADRFRRFDDILSSLSRSWRKFT